MICAQGTQKRTGKVLGDDSSIEDQRAQKQIAKFWKTLKSSPETMDEFDVEYKRPMRNKCTGDSGSKFSYPKVNKKALNNKEF